MQRITRILRIKNKPIRVIRVIRCVSPTLSILPRFIAKTKIGNYKVIQSHLLRLVAIFPPRLTVDNQPPPHYTCAIGVSRHILLVMFADNG